MGLIYVDIPTAAKDAVTIRAHMRPDRAAPHPEMVGTEREALSEGTIPAAGGSYGSSTSRMQTAGCAPLQPDNECGRKSYGMVLRNSRFKQGCGRNGERF